MIRHSEVLSCMSGPWKVKEKRPAEASRMERKEERLKAASA